MDSYNNLTLKTISMLEWSMEHCPKAQYVLKTDDDMYIHFPVLWDLLDKAGSAKRTIMGKVGMPPLLSSGLSSGTRNRNPRRLDGSHDCKRQV